MPAVAKQDETAVSNRSLQLRFRFKRKKSGRNRKQPEVSVNRDEEEVEVPLGMAERAGLTQHRQHDEEFLRERPEELLARLARVTRLCAITQALIFPEHPTLRAVWDPKLQLYVNSATRKPADCISVRDRTILIHRAGSAEPSVAIPMRKPDDLVTLVLTLEQVDRARRESSVAVQHHDLAVLTQQIAELSDRIGQLSVGPATVEAAAPSPALVQVSDVVDPKPDSVSPLLAPAPAPAIVVATDAASTWQQRLLRGLHLGDRDGGLLFWLSVAGVVSYATTWHGATAIGLRAELAIVATTFVCGFLWTLLVGLAMQHDKARKLLAELVLAAACIYCGFFTYYDGMTSAERSSTATELAARAHESLVAQVYGTHRAEAAEAAAQAKSYSQLKAGEISDGAAGSGVRGYGPRARELARLEGEATLRAAQLEGKLAALEQVVHTSTQGLTPDQIHLLDVRIWSAAPAEWRSAEAPSRDVYLDTSVPRSAVLLPIDAVQRGEPEAYVALACAALVEGIMIYCGLAIERRKKERLVPRLTRAGTRLLREGRDAVASMRAARQAEARARYMHEDEL